MTRSHALLLGLVATTVLALLPLPGRAEEPLSAMSVRDVQVALPPDLPALYFEATGHNVSGGFLRFWWENGRTLVFGYPLTEEFSEAGRTVQYFERARFEYYPEHRGTPYEVQLGHLGRLVTGGRPEAAFKPVAGTADSAERAYFEETGHTLNLGFKHFWEEHSGLLAFGYPISEELQEEGRTVQYFERARFEYFPEHQGTPYEVQLGHLGRQVARERQAPQTAVDRREDATYWTPDLPAEIALRLRQQEALHAVASPVAPFEVVVTVGATEVRSAPTTIADRRDVTYARHIVRVVGVATGEPVSGDDLWYQVTPSGGYIPASAVDRFTPPAPARMWGGRWIDVNLSTFYITAYDGGRPVRSAIITAGRDDRTPVGVFFIQRRVRSETMDSATVGIPKGHPEYYYLRNVEFVQYITTRGHALHSNYWVHPSRFGAFSSNGCVGLLRPDAAWFWEFAGTGTLVDIHY